MENLSSEKLINKNEKSKEALDKKINEENKENNNIDKNIDNEEENKKEGVYSTDFADKIELTEEERNLRQNYLKKVTKKDAIIRSIYLGKKAYISKLISFIMNIIYDILNIKGAKYKSDAVNSITAKDLDKFLYSVKYHVITTVTSKILNILEYNIIQNFFNNNSNNILLKNILYKKDMVFFDLFKTGELNNKVQTYQDYPYFNIIDTCSRIGEYIFKIFYFGYYLYKDFFEMSIICIIIILIQTAFEPYVYNNDLLEDEYFEKVELRENYINDILSNIRLIKSFGTEKKELNRLENIMSKIKSQSFFTELFRKVFNFSYKINEILIFYVCGKKTITGKMDYGNLLIFQEYSKGFNNSFINAKETFKSIKDGINSWVKFLQIYDIEQKIVSEKNIIPKTEENINNNKEGMKGLSICFNNVTFSYPTKKNTKIIDNFNLKAEPGKTIAIVGSSGSGKTTLTNLLLRFYDVDKGNILINGVDIKDIDLSWLRANIGIVSQEPILTSGTIRENILYGVDNYTEKKFIETCKLANVYSFATDKKLFPKEFETIVGERGIKVSGGQKQRIAIARALMKDAKILIFDEATSALDSENEAIVQESINNVINQKKITTIIIAHRLSTVKNANVIYVMNYGKIIEYGTHEELILKNGEYKKLIQRQLVQ